MDKCVEKKRGEPGVRGKTERKGQDSSITCKDPMLLLLITYATTIPHGIPLWVLGDCTRE
jgi:hypothetical protein